MASGRVTPELQYSEAVALNESVNALLAAGDRSPTRKRSPANPLQTLTIRTSRWYP
jgi:hypothetical protein